MPKNTAYGKGKNTDPHCLNDETIQLRFFKRIKKSYRKDFKEFADKYMQLLDQVEENNGKEFADKYRKDFNDFVCSTKCRR